MDHAQLKNAIELANYLMFEQGNQCKSFKIGPARGHTTAIASPLTNFVSINPVSAPVDEQIIEDVIALFQQAKLPFSWLLGDDNDDRLEFYLIDKGLKELEKIDGLAFDLTNTIPEANQNVEVRPAESSNYHYVAELGVNAYGLSQDVSDFYADFFKPGTKNNASTYFAYTQQTDAPISYGMMMDLPDDIVILCGASTMPEYRGQGVYKALLSARLLKAKQAGKKAAIVQALAGTSSPICQRYGFEKVYQQRLFAWQP